MSEIEEKLWDQADEYYTLKANVKKRMKNDISIGLVTIVTKTRSFPIKESYEETHKLLLEGLNDVVCVTEIGYHQGGGFFERKITMRAKNIVEVCDINHYGGYLDKNGKTNG